MQETNRCNDATFSCINFGLSCNPKNTAEMVCVRMGVDNGSDRPMSELRCDQFVTGTGCCFGGEWVDNDPAFCALYKRDVRNVITTHLPHAIGNFKKTVMRIELGVTPQTWVHRFWRRATRAYEVVPIYIGHHAPGSISDTASGQGGNKAALSPIKVAGI